MLSGSLKPKPFAALNHLTVPVATAAPSVPHLVVGEGFLQATPRTSVRQDSKPRASKAPGIGELILGHVGGSVPDFHVEIAFGAPSQTRGGSTDSLPDLSHPCDRNLKLWKFQDLKVQAPVSCLTYFLRPLRECTELPDHLHLRPAHRDGSWRWHLHTPDGDSSTPSRPSRSRCPQQRRIRQQEPWTHAARSSSKTTWISAS